MQHVLEGKGLFLVFVFLQSHQAYLVAYKSSHRLMWLEQPSTRPDHGLEGQLGKPPDAWKWLYSVPSTRYSPSLCFSSSGHLREGPLKSARQAKDRFVLLFSPRGLSFSHFPFRTLGVPSSPKFSRVLGKNLLVTFITLFLPFHLPSSFPPPSVDLALEFSFLLCKQVETLMHLFC